MARVVAAMSGGVDSSVTAALLQEQGHEVIGVHMKLHDVPAHAGSLTCCGLDDANDARRVASKLGIAFYVMNLREAFQRSVMDNLADTYLAGETPNPCIQCNGVLKFDVLLKRSIALGARFLATGHYARIDEQGYLCRAVDSHKDQSYFLFPMTPQALSKTLFPLGNLHKSQVRAHAERLGLATASKPESQDICFIPDGNHARFIGDWRPQASGAGDIVDLAGRVLGQHDGYYRYTVGQRRGLGVALGYPAYVVRIEPDTHRVVLGPVQAVQHRGLVVHRTHWFKRPPPGHPITVRIRHKGADLPCTVAAGEPAVVRLQAPATGIAKGQAAVFYQGDRVLGGGWIQRPLALD